MLQIFQLAEDNESLVNPQGPHRNTMQLCHSPSLRPCNTGT